MAEDSRVVYSSDGTTRTDLRQGEPRRLAPGRSAEPRDGIVRIRREKSGRRGKTVSVITGLPGGEAELRDLTSKLKRLCGSGGTLTPDGTVELQGDQRERLAKALAELGYRVKLAGG